MEDESTCRREVSSGAKRFFFVHSFPPCPDGKDSIHGVSTRIWTETARNGIRNHRVKKRNERIAWDKYVVCVVRRNNRAIADACECKWFNKSILCFFFNVVYSLNSYSYDDQPASASLHAWAMSMNMRAIEEEWKKNWAERSVKAIKTFFMCIAFFLRTETMMMMIIVWLHYVIWSGQTQTVILKAGAYTWKCDFFQITGCFVFDCVELIWLFCHQQWPRRESGWRWHKFTMWTSCIVTNVIYNAISIRMHCKQKVLLPLWV